MNRVANKYLLSAAVVVLTVFSAAFLLRRQPIYNLTKVVIPALSEKNDTGAYSQSYIAILKGNCTDADCKQDDSLCVEKWKRISSDKLFQLSLQQIINSSTKAVYSWPIVTVGQNDDLTAKFRMYEKEVFDIQIYFVKKDNKYVFERIDNFSKLLYYHPEYLNTYM
jgi:hypothetical protein